MALQGDLLRDRLRETFGTDSQEVVAQRLNMSQGNISKMLSGSQLPALETIYHIAKDYGVSVDWLLGLSECKTHEDYSQTISYATVIKSICLLLNQHTIEINASQAPYETDITFKDSLLSHLIDKCEKLNDADPEQLQYWLEHKLPQFSGLPFLPLKAWRDNEVERVSSNAVTDASWIEVYNKAKTHLESTEEFMKLYNTGGFGL